MVDLTQIRQAAERVARSRGLEIVDIDFLGSGKRSLLRVFIEKDAGERARLAMEQASGQASRHHGDEESGPAALDQLAWVTHEDCEEFSRDFGTLIEVEGLDPADGYTLEVSSPGLDRKLRGEEDYRRFLGSLVKVETGEPVAGNRHWRGRLTEVRAGGILLETKPVKESKSRAGKHGHRAGGFRRPLMEGEASALEISWANIARANLIPEI